MYTKTEFIAMIQTALKAPDTLYNESCFNYTGEVGGERYTEIAARELLTKDNLNILRFGIQQINRKNYKTASHETLAKQPRPEGSDRDEEWIAKELYGKMLNCIGKIIDFQTPLKSVRADAASKIDLLSYNEDTKTAYMLELKKPESPETLLRCILEAFTYSMIINPPNLGRSFGLSNVDLRPAILVFEDCQAYKDFHYKRFHTQGANVRQLLYKLGLDFFVLNSTYDKVIERWPN